MAEHTNQLTLEEQLANVYSVCELQTVTDSACVSACVCLPTPPPPHLTEHTVVRTCSRSGQKHGSAGGGETSMVTSEIATLHIWHAF